MDKEREMMDVEMSTEMLGLMMDLPAGVKVERVENAGVVQPGGITVAAGAKITFAVETDCSLPAEAQRQHAKRVLQDLMLRSMEKSGYCFKVKG